jgi:hypothetical protein
MVAATPDHFGLAITLLLNTYFTFLNALIAFPWRSFAPIPISDNLRAFTLRNR